MSPADLLLDPLGMPMPEVLGWGRTVIAGSALLLLTLELGLGVRKIRNRPSVRCRRTLRDLEHAAELVRPGNAYALSLALAETVREYLEHCHGSVESQLPTSQYLESMRETVDGHPGDGPLLLTVFLNRTHLARTADPADEFEAMESLLESARTLVRRVR